MLNPFLEKTLYTNPVQPILVEFNPNQLNPLMSGIKGLKLKVTATILKFGFLALAPLSPKIIKKVNDLPGVSMVHADQIKTIFQLPASEEWFPTSESRLMLGAEDAFKQGFTGESVKVGVCDTGIDPMHPQLIGSKFYSTISWPFREILDEVGHGCGVGDTNIFTTCGVTTLKELWDTVKEPAIWDNKAWVKLFRYPVYTYAFTPEGPKPALVKALHKIPGEQELVRIKTPTGELGVTPWHPLFIMKPGGAIQEKRADEIKIGDFLIHNAIPLDLPEMFNLDTEEAYCLGVMVGDGHIPTRQNYSIGIDCSSEQVINRVKLHWGESYRRFKNNCWKWNLKNANLRDQLIQWGFPVGEKADRLSIPLPVLKANSQAKAAFLAGWLDTDGHADKGRYRSRPNTTSPKLASEVRFLLGTLGIPSTLSIGKPSGRGKLDCFTVAIANTALTDLLERVGPYLIRKERWQRLIKPHQQGGGDILPWTWQNSKAVIAGQPYDPYKKLTPNGNYIPTTGKVLAREKIIELLEEMSPNDQRIEFFKSIRTTRVTSISREKCDDYLYDQTIDPWQSYIAGIGGCFFIHNTHCASTIAGKLQYSNMNIAVEGVSRSPLIAVKCLGRGVGTGFTSEIINAISTCYNQGSQIISMSLGSSECQGGCEACPECRIVKTLTDRGVMFAIAAGNSGPDENTIGCPGCSPSAITVAAVDKNKSPASFSSRGGSRFPGKPDVAAPGVNVYSGTARGSVIDMQDAETGFGYAAISGTSMATPHIAGFLSLLKQKYPDMTAERFKAIMAKQRSFSTTLGYGVPHWSNF